MRLEAHIYCVLGSNGIVTQKQFSTFHLPKWVSLILHVRKEVCLYLEHSSEASMNMKISLFLLNIPDASITIYNGSEFNG